MAGNAEHRVPAKETSTRERCSNTGENGQLDSGGTALELLDLQRRIGNRATAELAERMRASRASATTRPAHWHHQRHPGDPASAVAGESDSIGNRTVTQPLSGTETATHDLRITAADGPAEAQAEAVASDSGREIGPVTEGGGERPPESVQSTLARPSDPGAPLPAAVRADLEDRLGCDLGAVRLHTDLSARAAADALGARALTVGTRIFLGGGADRDSAAGARLLRHEVAHVVQQRGAPTHIQLDRKAKSRHRTVTKITFFVDRDVVVLELDGKDTVTLKTTYNGRPPPGSYVVTGGHASPPIGGVANARGWIVQWTDPPGTTLSRAPSYSFTVVSGRPGSDRGPATGVTEGLDKGLGDKGGDTGGGKDTGPGQKPGAKEPGGAGGGKKGEGQADKGEGAGSVATTQTGPGADPEGAGDEAAMRLTPEEEAVWREIAKLMKGAQGPASTESPAEVVRLFKVLRAMVVDPKFSTTGESWIKFAHFLDQNRDKIEGYFRTQKDGKITTTVLRKIINDYGSFLAMTKDQEAPGELKTDEDVNKEFKYDPGWRHLSPADRKLLLDYSREMGGEKSDKKIEFLRVGTSQKMMMALRLADTTVLGEIGQAAKTAFSDPKFLLTLVIGLGIYVGLLLTPDPSWVTKLAAGALTAVMLTQFAIQDVYGFIKAWADLADECGKATTTPVLKTSGEAFLKRIGPIGFDIMLFIVSWRLGKRLHPKLQKLAGEMAAKRPPTGSALDKPSAADADIKALDALLGEPPKPAASPAGATSQPAEAIPAAEPKPTVGGPAPESTPAAPARSGEVSPAASTTPPVTEAPTSPAGPGVVGDAAPATGSRTAPRAVEDTPGPTDRPVSTPDQAIPEAQPQPEPARTSEGAPSTEPAKAEPTPTESARAEPAPAEPTPSTTAPTEAAPSEPAIEPPASQAAETGSGQTAPRRARLKDLSPQQRAAVEAMREQAQVAADAIRQAGTRTPEGLPPGWDYANHPYGPKGRWAPGDPVNMPDGAGNHPSWDTIRERVWRTKAIDEIAARRAGASRSDKAIALDPIEELTPAELDAVAETGRMPQRVGAEIEHKRIPQRMGRLLEDAGLSRNEARDLTKLGDPSNLEPTHKEWHAVVDEKARQINPNRNPTLEASLDERLQYPLGSATNAEITEIVARLRARGVDLDATPAGREVKRILLDEKQRRGASATWEVE
jgi:Domain of unknown function (DUF4157)